MNLDEYCGITIDYDRDAYIDPVGHTRLRDSYMIPGEETSPQHRFAYVSKLFSDDAEHAQRLYDYVSNLWFGYSTPVLSMGRNSAGLPISCYLAYVEDSKAGLVDTLSYTNWLSMLGGGVGVYWSTRGEDEKSVGVIPHMKVYDAASQAYKQGTTRRGSFAMYLDIDHPDILSFMEMRKETGDQRRRCLNLHNGVNVSDKFMHIIEQSMIDPTYNDDWELKDPVSGRVHQVVSARALWASLLTLRAGEGRGEPYIHFIDNTNNAIRPNLKAQGYRVKQSNLCLTGNTLIEISDCADGSGSTLVSLQDFIEQFEMGFYSAPYVKSYDINTQEVVWSLVTDGAQTGIAEELYEIEDEHGNVIRCTADHPVLTMNRGYVKAMDLVETDTLTTL